MVVLVRFDKVLGFGTAPAVALQSQEPKLLLEEIARVVALHLLVCPRNTSRRGDTNANLTQESFIDTCLRCQVEREKHLHPRGEELPEALAMSGEGLSAAMLADVALGHEKADVLHTVYSPRITPAVRYRHIHFPAMRTREPLHVFWHLGHVEHLRRPKEHILHCVVLRIIRWQCARVRLPEPLLPGLPFIAVQLFFHLIEEADLRRRDVAVSTDVVLVENRHLACGLRASEGSGSSPRAFPLAYLDRCL
mmetsp:Transcript_13867/g.50516  ORF Transcript_13867/g.50516 Transcript_13867/m.50516 type:complete len:250 (-) Transcript_13867:664-1413(-)